jgi:hypothetical protein
MRRHGRDNYSVVGEGILTEGRDGNPVRRRPSTLAAIQKFRFSRLGPEEPPVDDEQCQSIEKVAED